VTTDCGREQGRGKGKELRKGREWRKGGGKRRREKERERENNVGNHIKSTLQLLTKYRSTTGSRVLGTGMEQWRWI